MKLLFVGGGNMGAAIVGGLVGRGFPAADIMVIEPGAGARDSLAARFGVGVRESAGEGLPPCEALVLAVKPQQMREVCTGIAATVRARRALVISIAAGTSIASITQWLGGHGSIVRCMPNTPALLQCGATALYAGKGVNAAGRRLAHRILDSVGFAAWVESEDLLHAVTALSGSGPAYFFMFMDAMVQTGAGMGLAPELARRLAAQTALGAARMTLESDTELTELRRRVTSPGGTTERAVQVFESGGLHELIKSALDAAADRSRELAGEPAKS